MKSREIFSLIVRVTGLLALLYTFNIVVIFFGAGLAWGIVIRAIVSGLVSIWLLRGAPQLVQFAYRDTDPL